MRRRPGRSNILRRLEELEARSTDGSRLVPHSPEWLTFWLKQFDLYVAGEPHARFTIDAMRAIMQALPDQDEAADSEVAPLGPGIAGENGEEQRPCDSGSGRAPI